MSVLIEDASHFQGEADRILLPSNEAQITKILQEARSTKTPVTVSGAGTGLTGARVPQGGILLSTEKLNRILKIQWEESTREGIAVVQPGVELRALQAELDTRGLFYPPDPGENTSFLGGNVATNASGPCSFKYGPTRPHVKRLRIVLPQASLLEVRRGERKAQELVPVPTYSMPAVKNAAGYFAAPGMDLIDLFIGSEGTLGIFTEIELAILKKPEAVTGGILFFPSEKECFRFAAQARQSQELAPRLLEFLDSRSLGFLSKAYPEIPKGSGSALFFEEECESGREPAVLERWTRGLSGAVWIYSADRPPAFFKEFRHDLPAGVNEQAARNGFRKIGTDFAVPDSNAGQMLDLYLETLGSSGMDACLFGHLGDNNLHANLLPKTQEEFERSREIYGILADHAIRLAGTVSAEHGIGKLRIPYLEKMVGSDGLKQMARVKKALDPEGILNPGNIFPIELLKEV